MRIIRGIYCLPLFIAFLSLSWQCAENPIDSDLSHTGLNLDTLSIYSVLSSASSYQTPPEIGGLKYLYFGSDSLFDIAYNLFTIKERATNGLYWRTLLDSSIQVDSLFLLFSSNDTLPDGLISNVGFSPDFTFEEYTDNYNILDTNTTWIPFGTPMMRVVNDTSDQFEETELFLDIIDYFSALVDTADSNLVRTFKLNANSNLESMYQAYSRNYSTGNRGPRIVVHFSDSTVTTDTTIYDTLTATFETESDLTLLEIDANNENLEYPELFVGSGAGYKTVVTFDFDSLLLPEQTMIRSANLFLYSSRELTSNYTINSYAINTDTTIIGQWFDEDPYIGKASFVSSASFTDSTFKFSVKNFLQNITLGNISNLGMILKPDDSADPFTIVEIDTNDVLKSARLEILYETR